MNGAMAPDQNGPNRPFPEAADYRTEIVGQYLCGPSMFPGGVYKWSRKLQCIQDHRRGFRLGEVLGSQGAGKVRHPMQPLMGGRSW